MLELLPSVLKLEAKSTELFRPSLTFPMIVVFGPMKVEFARLGNWLFIEIEFGEGRTRSLEPVVPCMPLPK